MCQVTGVTYKIALAKPMVPSAPDQTDVVHVAWLEPYNPPADAALYLPGW